jgi:hypothetical protein
MDPGPEWQRGERNSLCTGTLEHGFNRRFGNTTVRKTGNGYFLNCIEEKPLGGLDESLVRIHLA